MFQNSFGMFCRPKGFFPRVTSEGFFLCRSSAGAELPFLRRCWRVAGRASRGERERCCAGAVTPARRDPAMYRPARSVPNRAVHGSPRRSQSSIACASAGRRRPAGPGAASACGRPIAGRRPALRTTHRSAPEPVRRCLICTRHPEQRPQKDDDLLRFL